MADVKPICVDLCCGDFGGWAEGFLAEGYDVVGFDIERHSWSCYPGQLILQDILTLHGSQFKNATVIVASPPCQEYSYRAMPWKRAKALPPPDNTLFETCFRIQREASQSAARRIPLIVENVKGAEKWVGRARWHCGSYYLWGDVPALMPVFEPRKVNPDGTVRPPGSWFAISDSKDRGARKNTGGSWFNIAHNTTSGVGHNPDGRHNFGWSGSIMREGTSHGEKRKQATAMIAKIPFPLAQHIARAFKPVDSASGVRL